MTNLARMMQRNPLLLLALGATLIVAATVLIWLNISARHRSAEEAGSAARSARAEQSTQSVLFATREIRRGSVVQNGDVALRGVVAPAPSGSYGDISSVVGHVATANILAGQIVLGSALSADRLAAGVAALVGAGERAFSVRVSEDQIVGGFLRVNDRVDVYVTLPDSVYAQEGGLNGKGSDQSRSALILQDVPVLAVGEKLATDGADAVNGARTVTLAVAPAAVARLALADRLGKVALAIRNPSDKDVAPASMVGLSDLGAMSTETKAEPAAGKKQGASHDGRRITIYSGASTSTVTVAR